MVGIQANVFKKFLKVFSYYEHMKYSNAETENISFV